MKTTYSTTTKITMNATEVFPYERVKITPVVTTSSGSSVSTGTVYIYNNNDLFANITAGKSITTYGINEGEYEFHAVYNGGSSGILFWENDYKSSTSAYATFKVYESYQLELFANGKNETTIQVGDKVQISNKLHPIDSSSGSITYELEGGRTRSMEVNDYINMTFLGPGDYIYNATFEGDNSHGPAYSNKIIIHVLKITPTISFTVSNNATLGKPITIKATLSNSNITGNITYIINNKERATLNVGEDFTYTPYTKEDLKITVTYNGNRNYTSASTTRTITAQEPDKKMTITTVEIDKKSIKIGESIKVKAIVTYNGTIIPGTVTLTIGDTRYNGQNINEEVTYTPTSAGEINVYGIYSGTDSYEASESDFERVIISKYDPNLVLNLDSTVIYQGNSVIISGNMNNAATGDISVIVNNRELTKIANSGTYTFTPQTTGKYNITLKYNGDNVYNSAEISKIIDVISAGSFVLRVNDTSELTVEYGDTVVFTSII